MGSLVMFLIEITFFYCHGFCFTQFFALKPIGFFGSGQGRSIHASLGKGQGGQVCHPTPERLLASRKLRLPCVASARFSVPPSRVSLSGFTHAHHHPSHLRVNACTRASHFLSPSFSKVGGKIHSSTVFPVFSWAMPFFVLVWMETGLAPLAGGRDHYRHKSDLPPA